MQRIGPVNPVSCGGERSATLPIFFGSDRGENGGGAGPQTLLALPCPYESAETAVPALTSLFLQYRAPLVLKSDNGSAFVSEALAALLAAH